VRLVKEGHAGASTGMGFYDWSNPKSPEPRDFSEYHIAGTNDMVDLLK
jgi:3-hydroxyacyl-CoA dehydrogenase